MAENLEIEFKTLLDEESFTKAKEHFHVENQEPVIQINHYFDTDTAELKEAKMGLRVREFADHFEATLKIPQAHGLLEISDKLDFSDAKLSLDKGLFPKSPSVEKELERLHINTQNLNEIGSLKTARLEFATDEGLLALDESWYFDKHDFELELEVPDTSFTKETFKEYLTNLEIPFEQSKNKILRMIEAKK